MSQLVFGIRTPPASRDRAAWVQGRRVADTSRLFGPYIDRLEDPDFALAKDPLAHDRMLRDCQIRSCIRLRQMSVASRQIEFLPRADDPISVEAAQFATKQWAKVRRPSETLMNILDAIPRGCSFQEVVWNLDPLDFTWSSKDIVPIHKDRMIFSLEGEPAIKTPGDIFYGETLPPRVLIHHRYDPEPARFNTPDSESRLYFGSGEFDRIWPWFLWKQMVLRLGFAHCDRLAFPIKVGRYPFRNKMARAEMEQLLKDLDSHHVAVWPSDAQEGWSVDFMQAPATGHNIVLEWMSYIDTMIAKVILGTTMMNQEQEKGAFALGVVHERSVFGAISEFDSKSLCDTLENTWVKYLFEMNKRPLITAPKVNQALGKSMDLAQMVDIMLLLAERGFPVSVEQLAETTSIRPARPGETLLSMSLGGSGGMDMQHGPGSPFQPARTPEEMPGIMDGARGRAPMQMNRLKHLDVDILAEKSIPIAELGLHARKFGKQRLYKPAAEGLVGRRLGPNKEAQIQRAANQTRRIVFTYTNLKKQTKIFDVEPYSYRYRSGIVYLYAFDPADKTIKSFFAHKIRNVRAGKSFEPRFAVEIGND